MYIDNGPNVNAAWTKTIAFAPNGADWQPIPKANISSIAPVFIPNVRASVANRGYAYQDWAQVHIRFNDGTKFSFDVQDVKNQPTWNTGAASVQDGLNKAISDITSWL